MRKSCPRCSDPVSAATLERISVEDSPLRLTVAGMPAAKCGKGHAAAVDNEFMLWLIYELKEREAKLPAGEEKGLLIKKYFCTCGKELARSSDRRRSFVEQLAYAGYPAFVAEIELPVFGCPACGKEQLHSIKQAHFHTSRAIMALNDAAGFPHSA